MRLALILSFLAAMPALADDALVARAVAATEAARAPVMDALDRCAPGLPPLPVTLGDAETEAAQACVIETALRRHGRSYAMTLVREAESFARAEFGTLEELKGRLGPTLSSDRVIEIVQECGLASAAMTSPAGRYALSNLDALGECRG